VKGKTGGRRSAWEGGEDDDLSIREIGGVGGTGLYEKILLRETLVIKETWGGGGGDIKHASRGKTLPKVHEPRGQRIKKFYQHKHGEAN